MSSFTLPLIVKHLDGRRWELIEEFSYYVGEENTDDIILVPKGFQCDFASIPRLFWSVVGHPTGRYGKAAIIHDYLYFAQIRTRRQSDYIFYEAMEVLEVPFFKRWLMYHSVRTWGWMPWNKHKKRLKKDMED